MGLTRVLHTNSSYFNGSFLKGSAERGNYKNETNINRDFDDAYNYALTQEKRFYSKFFDDVETFEDFIGRLKDIFGGAEQDGKRIAKLGNANLKSLLDDDDVTLSQNLTYEIIFESPSEKLPLAFSSTVKDFAISLDGDAYISVDDAPGAAKKLANLIRYYKPVQELAKTNPGKFTESTTLVALKKWMLEEAGKVVVEAGESVIKTFGDTGISLKISNKNEKTTSRVIEDPIQIAIDFPLMTVAPSEIKKMLKDPETSAETSAILKKIYDRFEHFLRKQLGDGDCELEGHDLLRESFEKAWGKNAGTIGKFIDSILVGENLSAGLKGTLGEFQADIIFEYMNIACEVTDPKLGRIVGGITGGKRGQPRTDYQILEELDGDVGRLIAGIQVKNYSESMMTHVDINTDLGLLAPNLGDGFTDTLVNAQFNKDITSMAGTGTGSIEKFLKKYLNTYFWKGMNLNIGKDLDPDHTNTFYLMQGTSIVPASTIIKTIKESQKISNPKFTIDNFKKPTMGDKDFAQPEERPEFIKYWRDNQYLEGSVTEFNKTSYEGLLLDTRIHTSFNMSAILGANGGIENFRFY